MIVCVAEMIVGGTFLIFAMRKGAKKELKQVFITLLLFGFLGIAVALSQGKNHVINENQEIKKKAPGGGSRQEIVEVEISDEVKSDNYKLEIEEKKLNEKELQQVLKKAEKEAEASFLGDNSSLDEVTMQVYFPSSLQDGLVSAEWNLDNYNVVSPDGTINQTEIGEAGELVKASVELECQDIRKLYEFYFKVQRKKQTKEEKLWSDLALALKQKNEGKEQDDYYYLPESVQGKRIKWNEKKSNLAVQFAFLGMIAAVALLFRQKEQEKKERECWEKEMLLLYPEMVSKLTLLLGAGMSMATAWEKVVLTYQRQRKQGIVGEKAVYQEMLITYHEMKDGVGEQKAYLRFGERCYLQPYRKFVSLLTQNLRKRQKELTVLLENEAREAFEIRKNLAKKAGEEAGTKLLLPMMMMLLLVMVVILVPACMTFQM